MATRPLPGPRPPADDRRAAAGTDTDTVIRLGADPAGTIRWHVALDGTTTGTGITTPRRLCVLDPQTATDLITLVRVRNHDDVATVVADRLNKVPGVTATETHIAFRTYSQHDLESAFSLGLD